MTCESADIVILGHIAKDIIEVDNESYTSLGGAVYYGGIAGSHMDLKITIITRLKEEDFKLLTIFKKKGINYYAYPSAETSGLKNIYSSENMEFRSYEPLGFAGVFKKKEIIKIDPKFFVIGPIIAGEVDLELLAHLKTNYPKNLCLDIQGFIRFRDDARVFYAPLTLKEKKEIISNVNVLKVDQTEAEILTNQKNITNAAKEILKFGPREILITHEEGISIFGSNFSYNFPWKNKSSLGRTGRGDTAFISYLGSRITNTPEESLKFAAALTSLKLENPGPFNLSRQQVEILINQEYSN
ncbi:MAG: PfkB family carbohydrate kinase [Promethearchaeota archaeon]|jgi:sugar/nucleoside kinase (ribokinase family)